MAGSLSNSMENDLLDHVLKTSAYSQPANLWLALCTADPTESATGASMNEASGTNYARTAADSWDAASSRATENNGAITFPEAGGSWGTITHWCVVDSASGAGDVIAHGDFSVSRAINDGDTAFVADGDIDVSFVTDAVSTYLADALLDHILGGSAYTVPTNLYAAAADADINDATTGVTISEPGGGSYARELVNVWDAAASGASENTSAITFPEATGSWGTITDIAITDNASTGAGNILFYADMDTDKAIDSGDTLEFVAGGLDITLD